MFDEEYALPMAKKALKKKPVNALLVRPVVGKVKRTAFTLPEEGHVYGQVIAHDNEGAKQVINSWQEQAPRGKVKTGRDFVKTNRMAIKQGLCSAKDQAQFRAEHDIRVRSGPKKKPAPRIAPTSAGGYGYTNKGPQESMSNIMSNEYQRQWLQGQKRHLRIARKTKQKIEPRPTKASEGHVRKPKAEEKPMFRLKRFAKVPAKVTASMGSARAPHRRASRRTESKSNQEGTEDNDDLDCVSERRDESPRPPATVGINTERRQHDIENRSRPVGRRGSMDELDDGNDEPVPFAREISLLPVEGEGSADAASITFEAEKQE